MTRFWRSDWGADFFLEQTDPFETKIVLKPQSATQAGNLYPKRLQEVFLFCTVPVVLRNSTNSSLYGLIFGGHNRTGLCIAEDIFQKLFEKMG
jgi:hypothetical protein